MRQGIRAAAAPRRKNRSADGRRRLAPFFPAETQQAPGKPFIRLEVPTGNLVLGFETVAARDHAVELIKQQRVGLRPAAGGGMATLDFAAFCFQGFVLRARTSKALCRAPLSTLLARCRRDCHSARMQSRRAPRRPRSWQRSLTRTSEAGLSRGVAGADKTCIWLMGGTGVHG